MYLYEDVLAALIEYSGYMTIYGQDYYIYTDSLPYIC